MPVAAVASLGGRQGPETPGMLLSALSLVGGASSIRQVADARVGVVSSGGLTPSGVLLLRADA